MELLLVSLPAETADPNDQLEDLAPTWNKFATAAALELPSFKTGTLSELMTLADLLSKHIPAVDTAIGKTIDAVKLLSQTSPTGEVRSLPLKEQLLLDSGISYSDYLISGSSSNWKWDVGRWRVESRPLLDVTNHLIKDAQSTENAQRNKTTDYAAIRGQLTAGLRKQTGNLSSRSLTNVVSSEDFDSTKNSEYLDTILLAIPNSQVATFLSLYESFGGMTVPRSARKLAQDEEFSLYSVIVFKKSIEQFSNNAREHKFIVRDFSYNEADIVKSNQELEGLEQQEKELWAELVQLTRLNFSDLYQILIHLKILKVYVESVLRYGLPSVYFTAVFQPVSKSAASKLVASISAGVEHLSTASTKFNKTKNSKTEDDSAMIGEFANVLEGEFLWWVLEPVEDVIKE